MEKPEIDAKLANLFRSVFSNENLEINEATTANDVEGWDSLTHINLIVAVEKEFGISLTTRDVKSLKNVGDLMELIQRKTT